MAGIRPFISLKTCCAVVGEGLPERFADGAAMGQPLALIIARAVVFDGILIPTVSSPPLVTNGILSDFGIIIVSGPAQNFSAHFSASTGISVTRGSISSNELICTIKGLSAGLPFAANILRTASSSKAFAPSP